MTEERREQTFWGWVSENPITVVVILLVILGGVALVCGYREGFMSILGGLLGWIRGDDAENKRRLEETKKQSDSKFTAIENIVNSVKEQQGEHDTEVSDSVESAKAEYDDIDVDELIDIGNAMLADHGAFRGAES
jgi:hypothetical protein